MSNITRAEVIEQLESLSYGNILEKKDIDSLKFAVDSLKTDEAYEIEYENRDFIEIPEGATNGEVFETFMHEAYPRSITIYQKNEAEKTIKPIFSEDWWNSPYRKEQE